MTVKSRRLFAFALAGLLAVVLGWRPDAPVEIAPTPASEGSADRWSATIPLRILAKRQIARDVAAGRQTLTEAAALFRELNRLPPDLSRFNLFTGAPYASSGSVEEGLCRQVLVWVRSVMQADGAPGLEATAARLESEIAEMLKSPGGIRLPEAGSLVPARELLTRARNDLTPSERQDYFGHPDGGRIERQSAVKQVSD